ncbi:hypothetical protein ES703_51676 [subsurface metagenome]
MYDKNRRNDLDIQADILRVAMSRGGARKTQIVYRANLNFYIVKKYLNRLMSRGLLVVKGTRYFSTDKARTYIDTIEALYAL